MDWDDASDYCKETGGQLPTPTEEDDRLLQIMFDEIGSGTKIPLGFVNEDSKWMRIRDGQKNDSSITKVKPSLEILRLSKTATGLQYEAASKKDQYSAVVCEHRNSALSVIGKKKCDDGFVLLTINNASKCYSFHEFSNPSVDANNFDAVSSYCKSQNAELFEPVDSGDLHIMQKIGEASGFAVNASSKHIHRQHGYINHKVKNAKEEPITAAGYNFTTVGIKIKPSEVAEALCFMLQLPGGAEAVKTGKLPEALGTGNVINTDLEPEVARNEVEDLSDLGAVPEAKRTVRVFITSSVLYHVSIFVALFTIL